MYHMYNKFDREKYNKYVKEKLVGETMTKEKKQVGNIVKCRTLEQFRKKTANDLLVESEQIGNIPVNLDTIFEHYNVAKIPATFESLENLPANKGKGEISGLVLASGEALGVFYKKTDSIHRKRFTIAHELAHCCLHTDDLVNGYVEFRNPDHSDDREFAADIFAGELLIPESQLDYTLQRLIKPTLYGLAEIFEVSVNVMRARLEYLGKPYFDDSIGKYIAMES